MASRTSLISVPLDQVSDPGTGARANQGSFLPTDNRAAK